MLYFVVVIAGAYQLTRWLFALVDLIEGRTKYARRVYYTGTPSKQPNENASLLWCEVAHDAHGKEWNKIAQEQFEKGMGK